jgi:hypothetical protein
MPTFVNTAPFAFEFPGEGGDGRPLTVVEEGGTIDADTNPNPMCFVDAAEAEAEAVDEQPAPAEVPAETEVPE